METEIKEKDNDFDDMEKHIVCQSILLETYEKKNQILEENYKELQSEYSGSFDYYKKKIEQLEENNKLEIENTDRYKDIETLEEKHKKHIQDLEENYDHIYEAQKIAHQNEIHELKKRNSNPDDDILKKYCNDCKKSEDKINNLEHKSKELQKALDESNEARYKLKKSHFNLSVKAENDVKKLKEENSKLQEEVIKYKKMCSVFMKN